LICRATSKHSLKEVADLCRKVNAQGRSMGMALASCTVPQAGKPTFELAEDEMAIGIGMHGEPGRTRMKLKTAAEITELLAGPILDDLPYNRRDEVLAFVNGMGGTPLDELYIIYNELTKICEGRGVRITRNLIGSTITPLEMAGCSVTLLLVDDQFTKLWDAPARTPGLRWGI
jgi:phosphoenolpyruvate---glycerone phosphotransferase subunit DhaK